VATYLENLAEIHKAEAQSSVLRLQASERRLSKLQKIAQNQQLLEGCNWDCADPLTSMNAIASGLGAAANDLYYYTSLGRHAARPGSRCDGAYPPFYCTEQQHLMMVDAARTLEAVCPTAVNILSVLKQFAIFTGLTYTTAVKKDQEANLQPPTEEEPDDGKPETREPGDVAKPLADRLKEFHGKRLAAKAQKILDRWMKDVNWHEWEKEIFHRTRRDGESVVILEPDDETKMLALRSVEPEQIRDPHGVTGIINAGLGITGRDASWKFGILTSRRDTSKPIKYNVVSQYADGVNSHEVFDADEVWHVKINVDRCAKRGVSDFHALFNEFPRAKKLLRNLAESASVQASVAWVVEHAPGVDVGGLPDPIGGSTTTRTGKRVAAQMFDGPEALEVPQGTTYTAGPLAGSGQSETLIQVLQAVLRNIGSRWQIPEALVSGDPSNANLASALVAEAPFVKAMEARQWFYRNQYVALIERVLEKAAIDGLLPEGENLLDKIEVTCEMPPVVPRKALEETQKNKILSQNKILGNRSWSGREDLDRDEEMADMEVDPILSETIMVGMQGEEEADDDTASENSTSQNNERERVS